MNTFTIISGYEITNSAKHLATAGYKSLTDILNDLDWARNIIVQHMSQQTVQQKPTEKPFDVNAFLDAVNREKNSIPPQSNP